MAGLNGMKLNTTTIESRFAFALGARPSWPQYGRDVRAPGREKPFSYPELTLNTVSSALPDGQTVMDGPFLVVFQYGGLGQQGF